jgi:hypothetical protein
VVCGVAGGGSWREERRKERKKQFLSAMETLEQRTDNKLLEKTN